MKLLYFIYALNNFINAVEGDSATSKEWTGWGGNYLNNNWAMSNNQISSFNIATLALHCKIQGHSVSASPVTKGDIVYYPTWTGVFVALDYEKCKIVWQLNVTELIHQFAPLSALQLAMTATISRTSPQIDGDVLYFGTQSHALIVAVNRITGKVLAQKQLNTHPLAIITQSPTFYDDKLFVGTASSEEAATSRPDYVCCSFIGNMVALKFDHPSSKFTIVWDIPMIPATQAKAGWSGAGVWGSQPSIDENRGQLFIATGNSYSIPQVIIDCQDATANITAITTGLVGDPCLPDDIWQESVLAIDIKLGIVNWVHQLPALDAWTLACGIPGVFPQDPNSCPQTPGPDSDFGMAPAFVPGSKDTPFGKDTVVIGQKNGNLYAISAQSGRVFWSTATSPGSVAGGLSWGLAVDDRRVYFTAINRLGANWTLLPEGKVEVNNSAHGAASLRDGAVLWMRAVPGYGQSTGAPTVVGDLVLVSRSGEGDGVGSGNGTLMALRRETGVVVDGVGGGIGGSVSTLGSAYKVEGLLKGEVAVRGSRVMFGTGYGGPVAFGAGLVGSFYVLQVDDGDVS